MINKTVLKGMFVSILLSVSGIANAAIYECSAGMPAQLIPYVEASNAKVAVETAKRICYEKPVDPKFKENCKHAAAKCTEIEGSEGLQNYDCHVGQPMKLIENILAASKDEAGRIARRLCYENPENEHFKNNCYGSPVYCQEK